MFRPSWGLLQNQCALLKKHPHFTGITPQVKYGCSKSHAYRLIYETSHLDHIPTYSQSCIACIQVKRKNLGCCYVRCETKKAIIIKEFGNSIWSLGKQNNCITVLGTGLKCLQIIYWGCSYHSSIFVIKIHWLKSKVLKMIRVQFINIVIG